MGKAAALFLLLGLAFFPLQAGAEFYRYTDENGVLRYTDNLQEVPPEKRSQLKKYKEAEDHLTPAQREAKRQREAEAARQARVRRQQPQKRGAAADDGIRIGSRQDFERVKTDLDDAYERLMQKKAALEAERDTLETQKDVSLYRSKVRELNEEIQRFEDRRRRFIQKADQFNTRKK